MINAWYRRNPKMIGQETETKLARNFRVNYLEEEKQNSLHVGTFKEKIIFLSNESELAVSAMEEIKVFK